MEYIAVTGVVQNGYRVVRLADGIDGAPSHVIGQSVVSEQDLCGLAGVVGINYSVDGRNMRVKQDCGSFSRFSDRGSAVVVAELKSVGGKTMGYRLLSCKTGGVVNMKASDIIVVEEQYGDEHFIQNGMVRGGALCCYPNKPYIKVMIGGRKRETVRVSAKRQTPVSMPFAADIRMSEQPRQLFTREQLKELNLCQSNGVDSGFIRNPRLTPEQMRILWVSKMNGSVAEAFANPRLSPDVMKFYSDRLFCTRAVADCRAMLRHPELSLEELEELYLCICDGVPYEELIGMSATDINIRRLEKTASYWGQVDDVVVDIALRMAK